VTRAVVLNRGEGGIFLFVSSGDRCCSI
jgi:hypothetical protein